MVGSLEKERLHLYLYAVSQNSSRLVPSMRGELFYRARKGVSDTEENNSKPIRYLSMTIERDKKQAINEFCPYHPQVPVIPYQSGRWCKSCADELFRSLAVLRAFKTCFILGLVLSAPAVLLTATTSLPATKFGITWTASFLSIWLALLCGHVLLRMIGSSSATRPEFALVRFETDVSRSSPDLGAVCPAL